MSFRNKTLVEVAAAVATHLRSRGIDSVVVGGSAITAYVPEVYTSLDVDFVTQEGRRRVTEALAEIGFHLSGRVYINATTSYTVDIVGSYVSVDQRVVSDFVTIQTQLGDLRVLALEDALADRIAHWIHWSDNEALDVAERAIAAALDRIDKKKLMTSLESLSRPDTETRARYDLAMRRIAKTLTL